MLHGTRRIARPNDPFPGAYPPQHAAQVLLAEDELVPAQVGRVVRELVDCACEGQRAVQREERGRGGSGGGRGRKRREHGDGVLYGLASVSTASEVLSLANNVIRTGQHKSRRPERTLTTSNAACAASSTRACVICGLSAEGIGAAAGARDRALSGGLQKRARRCESESGLDGWRGDNARRVRSWSISQLQHDTVDRVQLLLQVGDVVLRLAEFVHELQTGPSQRSASDVNGLQDLAVHT